MTFIRWTQIEKRGLFGPPFTVRWCQKDNLDFRKSPNRLGIDSNPLIKGILAVAQSARPPANRVDVCGDKGSSRHGLIKPRQNCQTVQITAATTNSGRMLPANRRGKFHRLHRSPFYQFYLIQIA